MSDDAFGLERPFDIDEGQLDGMTPQQCFVLGYELALVDQEIASGKPISRMVHAANQDRIVSECKRQGRHFAWAWPHDDKSESWVQLEVAGNEPDSPESP